MTLTFLGMIRRPSVAWLTIVMAILASPACRADPVQIEIDIKPFIGTTTDPVTGKQTQFISQWEAGGWTTPPYEFSEIRLITTLDFSNPLGSDDFGAYANSSWKDSTALESCTTLSITMSATRSLRD